MCWEGFETLIWSSCLGSGSCVLGLSCEHLQPGTWAFLLCRALLLLVLYQSILQELSIACDIYAGVVVGFMTMHYFLS